VKEQKAAGDRGGHFANVRLWHLAHNPTAPAFVRFRAIADIGGFWPAMVPRGLIVARATQREIRIRHHVVPGYQLVKGFRATWGRAYHAAPIFCSFDFGLWELFALRASDGLTLGGRILFEPF
jgi:hypothetical protein